MKLRRNFGRTDRGQLLYEVCTDMSARPREVLNWSRSEQAFIFAARSERNRREQNRNNNLNQ